MSEQEILQWVISQYDVREEEWRPIDGYEGLYEISSHGRVKSLKGKKEMILKQRVRFMAGCISKRIGMLYFTANMVVKIYMFIC